MEILYTLLLALVGAGILTILVNLGLKFARGWAKKSDNVIDDQAIEIADKVLPDLAIKGEDALKKLLKELLDKEIEKNKRKDKDGGENTSS